jgi:hypothetical protein
MLNQDGKGMAGCLGFLLLLVAVSAVGVKIWPDYYACSNMNTDLKTEVSRAGANFLDDPTLMKNILQLAKRNEINLVEEQVKITRFAGQINVTVNFVSPVDLYFYTWNMNCNLHASSFIGRL